MDGGLLVEADADVFSFHHDLAREAIEGGLLGRERRRLHEAALDALRRAGSHDHVALAHHARGAGRYDEMVEEARLGAQAVAPPRLHLPGAAAGRDRPRARPTTTSTCASVATEAASLAGLLDDAAEHGDRWLAEARRQGDVSHEAKALSLRMRIAFDLGRPRRHGRASRTSSSPRSTSCPRRGAGHGDGLRGAVPHGSATASHPPASGPTRPSPSPTANGFETVRLAAMVEKGSALVIEPATAAEGAALLQEAADEAERTGDHVLAARALVNLVWQARMSSRFDEARELVQRMRQHAETAGFDSLASYARVEALAALAAADGDLDAALDVLDQGTRADPAHALPRNRRWLAVLRAGLALEADDLEAAATFTEEAKPVTARSRVGVLGLDAHLAARQGDLPRARERLAELLAVVAEEGYAPPSQVHDLMAASLAAGLDPAELRPFVEAAGIIPGHRLPADHPLASSSTRSWRRPTGARSEAGRPVRRRGRVGRDGSGMPARHRGTAHVGAARVPDRPRVDWTRRAPTPRPPPSCLARWRGWRVDELEAVQRRLGIGPELDRARRR